MALIGMCLMLCILAVQDCSVAKQNNAQINPDIFKAFETIEQIVCNKVSQFDDAEKDPELHLTNRELIVWEYAIEKQQVAAYGEMLDMSAQEYYDKLIELDYQLPPFYKDGYEPKQSWLNFWK